MKKTILMSVLFLVLFAAKSGETVNAQKNRRLKSTPKAFQMFYAKFRIAVVKGDKNTVASLTHFPFTYGFDLGDSGTFSKSQFIEKYDDVLGEEKEFFAQKNPMFYLEAGTYNLTDEDNASHYMFEKKGAGYKFTTYGVEP